MLSKFFKYTLILIASLFILSGCDYPVTNHKSTEKNKEIESCNKWFMSEAEINLCNLEIVNEVDKEINELIINMAIIIHKNDKMISTQASHVVSHHSTDWARRSLTSEIGRDPVLSARYDRWML